MADRSISLRLAVSGLEESLRAVLGFGEAGAAALDKIIAKGVGAGAPFDAAAAGATRARQKIKTEVDAIVAEGERALAGMDLGSALERVGGTGGDRSVSGLGGTGGDRAAAAAQFQAIERARQQTLAETARSASEAAAVVRAAEDAQLATMERLASAARAYKDQLDPAIALEKERARVSELVGVGLLKEAQAYEILLRLAQQKAGVTLQPGQDPSAAVQAFASRGGAGMGAEAIQGALELAAANRAEAESLEKARAATAAAREEYDRTAAAAQRYRESVDPSIRLEQLRAEVLEQVRVKAIDATEAYDRLTAAVLKEMGLRPEDVANQAPGSLRQFATLTDKGVVDGSSAREAIADLTRLKEVVDSEAESLARAREATAAARDEYDRIADAARRYREALDPSVALERERAEVAEMVAARVLDTAQAYDKLTDALARATGQTRQEIEASGGLAGSGRAFATVGPEGQLPAADTGRALADLRAEKEARDLAARAQQEQEAEGARLKTAYDAETNSLRNLVQNLSPALRLRQLEADLSLAVGRGLTDETEKTRLLAVATAQANEQRKQQDRLASGSHGGGSSVGFAVGDVFNQLQDVIVQVEGGTNIFRSLSQQLPQAAGALVYFGGAWTALGPIIGTVAGIAAGAAGVLFALGQSSADAAAGADKQKQAFDALAQSLGVSLQDADAFAARIDNLTEAQKGLLSVGLSEELDKQIVAFKAAATEAERLTTGNKSAAIISYAGQGPEATGVAGPTGDPTAAVMAQAVEAMGRAFQDGSASADAFRTSALAAAQAQHLTADEAAGLADKETAAQVAEKEHADAIKLVIAQYDLLHGKATQQELDLIDTAKSMREGAAAAEAYAKALQGFRNQASLPPVTDLRDRYIAEHVNQLDPSGKQLNVQQHTEASIGFGKEFDAKQQAADEEALNKVREKTSSVTQQATDSTDKYAKIGQAEAEGARSQLGTRLAATEAGQKEIAEAGRAAEASARHSDALAKEKQAQDANARAALTHAENQKVLAAGTDKVTQAQREGEEQARKSGVTSETLIRQLGQDAAARERQKEATSAAAQAQQFADKTAGDLAVSEAALAAAQAGGLATTRDAIAGRQAEVAVINAGIKASDDRYAQLVREQKQIILNKQALDDLNKVAQVDASLREQLAQKRFFGYTPEGRPILQDEGGGYKTEKTATVQVDELYGGRPTNIPTIWGGQQLDVQQSIGRALNAYRQGMQFPNFDQLDQSLEHAKQRTEDLTPAVTDLEEAYKRQDFITAQVIDKLKNNAALERMSAADKDLLIDKESALAAQVYETNRAYEARRQVATIVESGNRDLQNNADLLAELNQNGLAAEQDLQNRQQIQEALRQKGITPERVGRDKYDDAFWTEYANRAAGKVLSAQEAATAKWHDEITSVFTDAANQFGKVLGDSLDNVFKGLNETGKVDFGGLFQNLAQGFQGIGQNFLGQALQAPFKHAADMFGAAFKAEFDKSGDLFASLKAAMGTPGTAKGAFGGAVVGSVIGGVGGTIGTAITGNPNTGLGASLGGVIGGVAGSFIPVPVVGTLLGAAVGTAIGGIAGSLFGADSAAKNRANATYVSRAYYDPEGYGDLKKGGIYGTGTVYRDDSASPQNRERLSQLTDTFNQVDDLLASVGAFFHGGGFDLSADDEGGIKFEGKTYDSADQVVAAYIKALLHGGASDLDFTRSLSDTQRTILQNTTAKSAQALQGDLTFAGTYDQLAGKQGTYGAGLAQLVQTYAEASIKANRLGLDTAALAAAETKAEDQLRQQTLVGIRTLMGTASPLAKALLDLNQQFTEAGKNAKALGISQSELNAAQAKQVALLKQQYQQQYAELTGQSGGFAQALFKLRADFKSAAAIGSDLGIDTSNLPQLQAQQELKLRQQFIDQFNQLTDTSSGLAQTIQQLRDNFKQAADLAKELGLATTGLAQKEHDAEVKAYRDAETQLRQQLTGQAQQVRSFVDGLVNPLKQALSGLGPLAGYTSPTQSIASGLAEFRKTFQGAQNDNVADIQGLPQQAQQLLQLARQYLGSGPQFAAIFKEVQDDLKNVLATQETRGNAVEASIPDAIEQSAQQQIDVLTSGFGDVVTQLQQLHDDWARLNPGQPVPVDPPRPQAARAAAAANQTAQQAAAQGSVLRLAVDPPAATAALRAMVDPVPAGSVLRSLLVAAAPGRPVGVDPAGPILTVASGLDKLLARGGTNGSVPPPAARPLAVDPTGSRGVAAELVKRVVDPLGPYIEEMLRAKGVLDPAGPTFTVASGLDKLLARGGTRGSVPPPAADPLLRLAGPIDRLVATVRASGTGDGKAAAEGNRLIADVAAAVRIAGDKQTTVLADGFTRLDARLQSVEGKLRLLQGGRLGRAA